MNDIEQILKDLYASAPDLKEHEPKLRVIISRLLETRPNAHLDPHFAETLRRQLLQHADVLQSAKAPSFWNKYRFAFAGSFAVVVLAVGAYFANQYRTENPTLALNEFRVDRLKSNAFGSFATLATAEFGGRGGDTANMSAPQVSNPPMAGVESDAKITSSRPQSGGGGGTDAMIYQPININYKYVGEALPTIPTETAVFRRIRDALSGVNAGSLLRQLGSGLINTSAFGNSQLDYLSVSEDKEFGYTISFSVPEGVIYINQNWRKWPNPAANCSDEACYRSLQMNPADMPGDEEVIRIANDFLRERGISTENYGKAVVQNQWQREYTLAADKSTIYIPDTLSVVYPNLIEGSEVYDEGGSPSGLYVSVNVRYKKVSGTGEITGHHYESSNYATETDTAKIISIAENGGFRNYAGFDSSAQTITEELGTPTFSFVRVFQYDNNTNTELFVPAYIFPVITDNAKQPYYRPMNVIVPIVSEILKQQANFPPIGILDRPEVITTPMDLPKETIEISE